MIDKEDIEIGNFSNKKEIVKYMVNSLNIDEERKNNIILEILKREEIENTVIGYGVAIPHTKTDQLEEAKIKYMKLKKGIKWSNEEDDVYHIFMLIIPKSNVDLHIEILKSLSLKLLDENFREELNNSNDVEKICNLINRS